MGSYARRVYCTPPFNLADISQDRDDPAVYLMTMSSSPGILDDDEYDVRILAEAGSRMMLRNQGYQRIFNMRRSARQNMELCLEEGSEVSYIQHPVVPHKNASVRLRTEAQLADRCILTIAEIITCGRKLCGEIFQYRRLHTTTSIFHGERLLLKDNILLEPERVDPQGLGLGEGFSHQGTLIYANTRSGDSAAEQALAEDALESAEGVVCGLSRPLPSLLVVRALANGGEPLYDAFRSIETAFWQRNGLPVRSTQRG